MIKLGVLDLDTSHAVQFAKRLNHKGIAEDQWVAGASIVVGCPGESMIAPGLIAGYRKELEALGVLMVEKPEAMIGKVDGMLIESQQGGVHLRRARPFLEAGIPCFIDKPFTCGVADARQLVALAAKHNVPIFSSSSLRYAPELVQYLADSRHGKVLGAFVHGPAPLDPGNPGLYHYGIHAVEILYTIMGPGCERVTCLHEKDADVVSGQWKDGRVASVRGNRSGGGDYGCTVFAERGTKAISIGTTYIYRELLKKIVEMFTTKKPPLDIHVTFEIVAFIEAALQSGINHGAGQTIDTH
jgi:virulence factor